MGGKLKLTMWEKRNKKKSKRPREDTSIMHEQKEAPKACRTKFLKGSSTLEPFSSGPKVIEIQQR